MSPKRHPRKLKNLLLNRRFQLKYTTMVLGLSIVLSVALGTFLLMQVRENSRMLRLDAEFDPVFQAQLAQSDAVVVATMVGALVAFNLLLAAVSVVVTHRMAGPVWVIERYLRTLGQGRLPKMRGLRRGDEFVELWTELRRHVDVLEAETLEDIEALERAIESLDDGEQQRAARAGLEEILVRNRRFLGAEDDDSGPSLDAERSTA